MLDRIDQCLDVVLNPTVGKWCARFWLGLMAILFGVVMSVMMIGLADKVGWIFALGILALIITGLMSIFAAFNYWISRP